MSPYQLVYGHDDVLPWEVKIGSRRLTMQDQLTADEYCDLMKDELVDLIHHRLVALEKIEANKARIAMYYNKKVAFKEFHKGDLV